MPSGRAEPGVRDSPRKRSPRVPISASTCATSTWAPGHPLSRPIMAARAPRAQIRPARWSGWMALLPGGPSPSSKAQSQLRPPTVWMVGP